MVSSNALQRENPASLQFHVAQLQRLRSPSADRWRLQRAASVVDGHSVPGSVLAMSRWQKHQQPWHSRLDCGNLPRAIARVIGESDSTQSLYSSQALRFDNPFSPCQYVWNLCCPRSGKACSGAGPLDRSIEALPPSWSGLVGMLCGAKHLPCARAPRHRWCWYVPSHGLLSHQILTRTQSPVLNP